MPPTLYNILFPLAIVVSAIPIFIPIPVAAQTPVTEQTESAQEGAPGQGAPQVRPTLNVSRAPGPIEIDGDLTDPGWQDAARATGFVEYFPTEMAQPPFQSEAWVTYDDENLYIGLV